MKTGDTLVIEKTLAIDENLISDTVSGGNDNTSTTGSSSVTPVKINVSEGSAIKRKIPDDNSCLFHAIAYISFLHICFGFTTFYSIDTP